MSVPLRTLAGRAEAEITLRHAAKLTELEGLLPADTRRTAAFELADPANGSKTRRGVLGTQLG